MLQRIKTTGRPFARLWQLNKKQKQKLARLAEKLVWQLSEDVESGVDNILSDNSEKQRKAADEYVWRELARVAKIK